MRKRAQACGSVRKRAEAGSVRKRAEACGSVRKRAGEACGSVRKRAEACGSVRAYSCASVRKRAEACGSVRKRAEARGSVRKRAEACGWHYALLCRLAGKWVFGAVFVPSGSRHNPGQKQILLAILGGDSHPFRDFGLGGDFRSASRARVSTQSARKLRPTIPEFPDRFT